MVSKIGSTVHYSLKDQLVRVHLRTAEIKQAVAKFGNLFWRRSLSGGGVMLIPVPNGIPRVADFIIVNNEDIIHERSEVGYGSSATQGDKRGE